jgi:hypothetical protein
MTAAGTDGSAAVNVYSTGCSVWGSPLTEEPNRCFLLARERAEAVAEAMREDLENMELSEAEQCP